jgi:site-specific DNA-methyltransferase (adenine-specific)
MSGKFILGDCMDKDTGLPSLPDAKDAGRRVLAIVDPPYGIGEDGLSNHSKGKLAKATFYTPKKWDSSPPDKKYFDELRRVSHYQIIWGANHFISRLPYDSPCWVVWDKQNGESDFADCELAWTNFKSAVRVARFRWNGMLQGNTKQKERRIHPTQKPAALYRWLLENYAEPLNKISLEQFAMPVLILDTHVGSASSLIACEQMGFDYLAWEKDADYYAAAKNRMSKGVQGLIKFE